MKRVIIDDEKLATSHARRRLNERKIPLDLIRHVIETGNPPVVNEHGAMFYKDVRYIHRRLLPVNTPPKARGLRVVTSHDGTLRTAYWLDRKQPTTKRAS